MALGSDVWSVGDWQVSNEQVDTWTELPTGSNTAAAYLPAINIRVISRMVHPEEADF